MWHDDIKIAAQLVGAFCDVCFFIPQAFFYRVILDKELPMERGKKSGKKKT